MDTSLSSLFNLYVLPSGRRLFALRGVERAAKEMGQKDIAKLAREAIVHEERTMQLNLEWKRTSQETPGSTDVRSIDIELDRLLTLFRDGADVQMRLAGPGSPEHARLVALMRAAFPAGLAAMTSLSYVEQAAAVEAALKKIKAEHAETVEAFGLEPMLKKIERVSRAYREALRAAEASRAAATLDFGTVRAARAAAQDYLLQVVAVIVGTFPRPTEADEAARAQLLGPVLAQDEQVRLSMKARRVASDIDPASGAVNPSAPEDSSASDG